MWLRFSLALLAGYVSLDRAVVGAFDVGWKVARWQLACFAVVVKAFTAVAFAWAGAVGAVALFHVGLVAGTILDHGLWCTATQP